MLSLFSCDISPTRVLGNIDVTHKEIQNIENPISTKRMQRNIVFGWIMYSKMPEELITLFLDFMQLKKQEQAKCSKRISEKDSKEWNFLYKQPMYRMMHLPIPNHIITDVPSVIIIRRFLIMCYPKSWFGFFLCFILRHI